MIHALATLAAAVLGGLLALFALAGCVGAIVLNAEAHARRDTARRDYRTPELRRSVRRARRAMDSREMTSRDFAERHGLPSDN